MFSTEEKARKWFESNLAKRQNLSTLRWREHPRGFPQDHALLVPGLPQVFQRAHWHGDCQIERAASEVGHRHLSLPDFAEVRVEHETTARHQGFAADRLVHAAPDPRSLGLREHR